MRIVLAFLFALPIAAAEPSSRASSVANALGVDERTRDVLVEVLSWYDAETYRLQEQRSALKIRLATARHESAKTVERMFDEALANQRAQLSADEWLVGNLRRVLPPKLTAQVLTMLSVTDHKRHHDVNALWPPGSTIRLACDPFAAMHGCGR